MGSIEILDKVNGMETNQKLTPAEERRCRATPPRRLIERFIRNGGSHGRVGFRSSTPISSPLCDTPAVSADFASGLITRAFARRPSDGLALGGQKFGSVT